MSTAPSSRSSTPAETLPDPELVGEEAGPSPTISVLMPAYNAEPYIGQAIESVLGQSFSDFEFIIVDDGSTDGTRAIVERFTAEDPRIRLFSRPNTGLIGARNDTLAAARGEFLAFLDADDIALPGRFERQVAFLGEHPEYVLVGSRVILIDPEGETLRVMGEALDHEELERGLLEAQGQLLYTSAIMARRRPVLEIGGYTFDTDPAEDLDLNLRLAEVGRMAVLDEPASMYREHFSKVGHTRAERQGNVCRAILIEAHERRGLPVPELVRELSFRTVGRGDRHQTWGWWALGAGHVSTARKHARSAVVRRPLSLSSWRLLCCTLRGR